MKPLKKVLPVGYLKYQIVCLYKVKCLNTTYYLINSIQHITCFPLFFRIFHHPDVTRKKIYGSQAVHLTMSLTRLASLQMKRYKLRLFQVFGVFFLFPTYLCCKHAYQSENIKYRALKYASQYQFLYCCNSIITNTVRVVF